MVLTFEPTMDAILYYLVDPHGKVYVKHEAQSFAEVAREFGLTESTCQEYRLDVPEYRRLVEEEARGRLEALVTDDVRVWCKPTTRVTYGKPYREILPVLTLKQ